jgi:hypothetical protein
VSNHIEIVLAPGDHPKVDLGDLDRLAGEIGLDEYDGAMG